MTNLKERLFQKIKGEKNPTKAIATAKANQKVETPRNLPKAIATWQKQATQVTWQPYLEGITISRWELDTTPGEVYWFVRLTPGTKFPSHDHAGQEEIIMLEGDLTIEGQVYYPGDYIYSPPGTIHQPETTDGCLVLVRESVAEEIFL